MKLNDPSLLQTTCFINGKPTVAADGSTISVTNPANNTIIGTVPNLNRQDVTSAILAAQKAYPLWKKLLPLERAKIMYAWSDLIKKNIDDLAIIMTMEQGKPLAQAYAEILSGITYITWYADEGQRLYGEVIPSTRYATQSLTIRQPVGVTAAITPWNFPMSMITRKAAPALAAGCPTVIKPASSTPFSALALAELAKRAGFPDGVFTVITGNSSLIGEELCSSPIVRKLSFTGSTSVGKILLAASAQTVKKVSMELGGNAPAIICPDANLDLAVQQTFDSKFGNAGQICVSINRIFVHHSIHDIFVKKLIAKVESIVIGNGLEPGVTQGPMINEKAANSLVTLVQDALEKGAVIHTGGRLHKKDTAFFMPTVLTGMTPDMRVFREEIFGPIASIMAYQSEDEVIALANDTEYGLASYVFTENIKSAYKLPIALEYGMVGVNEIALASSEIPFGGIKQSGIGREGGRQGIDDFLETKYIITGDLE